MLLKLKGYLAAFFAFIVALLGAAFYRQKAKALKKQVRLEKAKAHNLEAQRKAQVRLQEKHRKEIEDATKDDSYLNYFDDTQ